MSLLIDLKYVRGMVLTVLARQHQAMPGDPIGRAMLGRVMAALYQHLESEVLWRQVIPLLIDRELVVEVSDQSVPLHLRDLTSGFRITESGLAVVAGDAASPGVLVG